MPHTSGRTDYKSKPGHKKPKKIKGARGAKGRKKFSKARPPAGNMADNALNRMTGK